MGSSPARYIWCRTRVTSKGQDTGECLRLVHATLIKNDVYVIVHPQKPGEPPSAPLRVWKGANIRSQEVLEKEKNTDKFWLIAGVEKEFMVRLSTPARNDVDSFKGTNPPVSKQRFRDFFLGVCAHLADTRAHQHYGMYESDFEAPFIPLNARPKSAFVSRSSVPHTKISSGSNTGYLNTRSRHSHGNRLMHAAIEGGEAKQYGHGRARTPLFVHPHISHDGLRASSTPLHQSEQKSVDLVPMSDWNQCPPKSNIPSPLTVRQPRPNFVNKSGKALTVSTSALPSSALRPNRPPKQQSIKQFVSLLDDDDDDEPRSVVSAKGANVKRIGLTNLGNTCYMNAVLNALISMRPFVDELFDKSLQTAFCRAVEDAEEAEVGDDVGDGGARASGDGSAADSAAKINAHLFASFLNVTNALRKEAGPVDTSVMKKVVGHVLPQFAGDEQQDAHEFLTAFIERLDGELQFLTKMSKRISDADATVRDVFSDDSGDGDGDDGESDTAVSRLLVCEVVHELTCTQCTRTHHVTELYRDFSVVLLSDEELRSFFDSLEADQSEEKTTRDDDPSAPLTLAHLLKIFFADDDVERRCSKCKNTVCTVTHRISKLPRVLVVHLKRFSPNYETNTYEKLCNPVLPSAHINLEPWTKPSAANPTPFNRAKVKRAKQEECDEFNFKSVLLMSKLPSIQEPVPPASVLIDEDEELARKLQKEYDEQDAERKRERKKREAADEHFARNVRRMGDDDLSKSDNDLVLVGENRAESAPEPPSKPAKAAFVLSKPKMLKRIESSPDEPTVDESMSGGGGGGGGAISGGQVRQTFDLSDTAMRSKSNLATVSGMDECGDSLDFHFDAQDGGGSSDDEEEMHLHDRERKQKASQGATGAYIWQKEGHRAGGGLRGGAKPKCKHGGDRVSRSSANGDGEDARDDGRGGDSRAERASGRRRSPARSDDDEAHGDRADGDDDGSAGGAIFRASLRQFTNDVLPSAASQSPPSMSLSTTDTPPRAQKPAASKLFSGSSSKAADSSGGGDARHGGEKRAKVSAPSKRAKTDVSRSVLTRSGSSVPQPMVVQESSATSSAAVNATATTTTSEARRQPAGGANSAVEGGGDERQDDEATVPVDEDEISCPEEEVSESEQWEEPAANGDLETAYHLQAVILHHGERAGSGHYTCVTHDMSEEDSSITLKNATALAFEEMERNKKKRGPSGSKESLDDKARTWRHHDDSRVKKCTLAEALGGEERNTEGYIYFYVNHLYWKSAHPAMTDYATNMTHVFHNYEQEWHELRQQLKKRLEDIPKRRGDAKRREIAEAQEEIEEAAEILESMDLSAKSIGDPELEDRVQTAEDELADIRRDLRRAETFFGGAGDREKLLGGDLAVTSLDQREQLLSATDKMRHTGDVIKHAMKTANEAENMGVSTLGELHMQREKIDGSRDKLRGVNDSLYRAQRVMRGISRRVMTNKLISMCIILFLLAAIVVVCYLAFFSGGEGGGDETTTTTTTTVQQFTRPM